MSALTFKGGEWLAQLKKIKSPLEGHIMEEETQIFPAIPKVWDQAKLDQAGQSMEKEKRRKLQETAAR